MLGALLLLAPPAHAAAWPEPGQPVRHAAVEVADELGSGGRHDAVPRAGLPFAPPDLALLLLGGAVVTMAASGAPLLLRLPPLTRPHRGRRTVHAHA